MNVQTLLERQWPYLLSLLPQGVELDSSARRHDAWVRRRGVPSAESLLRLAFAYALCELPLRRTVAWAEALGVASLSNVALLKRLRKCDRWLGWLLGITLAERASTPAGIAEPARVRLVGAATIGLPEGASRSSRIHLGYDLQRCCVDQIVLTDHCGSGILGRLGIEKGELVVGERECANRPDLHHAAEAQAHFIVRLGWNSLPFAEEFDHLRWLASLREATMEEVKVRTVPDARERIPAMDLRLVAMRMSEPAAEAARRRSLGAAARGGDPLGSLRLVEASHVCLATNTPPSLLTAREVLGQYRFRWRVERAFESVKSLLQLGHLPARDPALARTYLYAKLLGALLLDDLSNRFLELSPWGYPLP